MKIEDMRPKFVKKRHEIVLKYAQPGTMVRYAGSDWKVAHQKEFPHGIMVGIYDEPPSKHVDYINPANLTLPWTGKPPA